MHCKIPGEVSQIRAYSSNKNNNDTNNVYSMKGILYQILSQRSDAAILYCDDTN